MNNTGRDSWLMFVVPGSRFDLGWCASPAETFAYSDIIIRQAVEAIKDEFPDYRFTVEYAMFLKHFLDTYPGYRSIVEELIDQGKLEVCAAWTGMMDQIIDGEAMIRNVVMAKRWAAEELGIDLATAQLSDCPGHTIQLPQVLAKCGVQYLAYSRYSAPVPIHWWRSPDGSRIIAANHSVGLYKSLYNAAWAGSGYGWGGIFRRKLEEVEGFFPKELKDIENIWPQDQPVLMGEEMDLIPAYPAIVNKLEQWNEKHPEITLELSTTTQFFEAVNRDSLPEFCGEAPYEFYTLGACRPKTYIGAKYAHHALTTAEKLGSLQEILDLGQSNKNLLDEAWEALTIPHDHNVGGRHGEINDMVRHHCVEKATINARNVTKEAMLFIMTHIDYPLDTGIPVVLFNPLSWERSEAVETYIEVRSENIENISVFDPSGERVPTQLVNCEENHGLKRPHFLFLAKDMPSIGYKAFYVKVPNEKPEEIASSLSISQNVLENDYLRVSIENGIIKSLIWKQNNNELSKEGFGEIIVYEDVESDIAEKLTGQVWHEVEVNRQVKILESGPLRGKIQIQSEVLGCSIIKELALCNKTPWLELSVTIDWSGEKNREVVLSLPFNVPDGRITYETPYGHVELEKDELPGTYRGRGGRYVQKWVDVSNFEMGVMVGTDCISHILKDTDVNPMLIRTAYSCGTPNHWYHNIGKHTFKFSILPHAGHWRDTNAFHTGWQQLTPMPVGRMNICAPIAPIKGSTFLPQSHSLCRVSSDNVVLTTIKKSDDGGGYIARLVEITGKSADVTLEFGFDLAGAWKTDLMEQDIEELDFDGNTLKLEISPYEICSIRFLVN